MLHSCWCIILFECGLNSNFDLNSNFVCSRNRKGAQTLELAQTQKNPAQLGSKPNPRTPLPSARSISFHSRPSLPLLPSPRGPHLRQLFSRLPLGPASTRAAAQLASSPRAPAFSRKLTQHRRPLPRTPPASHLTSAAVRTADCCQAHTSALAPARDALSR